MNLNSLKLNTKGIKTKIPPAGDGMPSKKLSLQDDSASDETLNLATQPPAVVMVAGLHGSGKTTSIAK